MIITEAIGITSAIVILIGCKKLCEKLGYKIKKRKLKKALKQALSFINTEDLNVENIQITASKLLEFDVKNSSKKMDKTLEKFLRRNPELNCENLKEMCKSGNFSNFDCIYDITEEQKDEDREYVDDKLKEIEMRRNEILRRKQKVKTRAMAKEKARGRQNVGAMG